LASEGGKINVQGEEVKKLDILANDIFVNSLTSSGKVAVMVSEENENAIFVSGDLCGRYCITFDPLDGSSNIDCGVSIGTIFGIYKLVPEACLCNSYPLTHESLTMFKNRH
jgi:fructose-1,6-bisphosphatase I